MKKNHWMSQVAQRWTIPKCWSVNSLDACFDIIGSAQKHGYNEPARIGIPNGSEKSIEALTVDATTFLSYFGELIDLYRSQLDIIYKHHQVI